jgi:hypothetical protein
MAASLGPTLQKLKRFFHRLGTHALDAATVLWITRVSVISAVAGAILFIAVGPVRDTFLESRGDRYISYEDLWRWFLFFSIVLFFWVLPVHYAARRNVRHDPFFADSVEPESDRPTGINWWGLWIPRVLAVACLASIAIGALLARNALRVIPATPSPQQLGAPHDIIDYQTIGIAVLALLLGVGVWIFLQKRRYLFGSTSQQVGNALLIAVLGVFIALIFIPVSAFNLTRAALIPVLIGGWIPLLALLAYYGRMTRLPLILGLFIVLEVAAVYGANHNVRDLWAKPDGSVSRSQPEPSQARFIRPSLDSAIQDWKTVNCANGTRCPRPIVVAASGGASRAGFFTAATLGHLLDQSRGNPEMNDFRNQLFAISTVSGSSAGAAFFAAALRAENNDGSNPCSKLDDLTYLTKPPGNWKECLEELLAGDFISPTLFSYVFKEAAQGVVGAVGAVAPRLTTFVGIKVPGDRATVLEKSWEARFCEYAGIPKCDKEAFKGLEAPFLSVADFSDNDRAAGKWYPMLFFNSTDVDTGRRVVISPVTSKLRSDVRLFGDAYDLHDLLADDPDSEESRPLGQQGAQPGGLERDISLSTAALLSARFPLISPPGVVLNLQGRVVARLIDGGYFENFGATTAVQIAQKLKQAGLDPFLIEITNDPELLVASVTQNTGADADASLLCRVEDVDPLCDAEPPINEVQQNYWFSDVRGPLSGLFGSRNAHGGEALRGLAKFGGPGTAFCPSVSRREGDGGETSFVHIVVHPQYQVRWWTWWDQKTCARVEVPLNWWLSKPVQAYLDDQIAKNRSAIDEVFKVMLKEQSASRRD